MQGEDGSDRVSDVLPRPVRAHRVPGRVLARFWAWAFWANPCSGDRVRGTSLVLVLQGCSRSWRNDEGEARERGAPRWPAWPRHE